MRLDGQSFPAEVLLSPLTLKGETVFIMTARDITERKQTEEALKTYRGFLENLSITDGLTGIANRRRFDQFLDYEWQRAMRNQTRLSLIMLDIDCFKAYNDHYGHPAGDQCIRVVASTVRHAARRRPLDIVGRYGGEELVAVLYDASREHAESVARTLVASVGRLRMPHVTTAVGAVTISVGAAVEAPGGSASLAALMKRADEALYAAKAAGRNNFVIAGNPPTVGFPTL